MIIFTKPMAFAAILVVLTGCVFVTSSEVTTKTKLPPITVTIEGKEYEVRRNKITSFARNLGYEVGEREVWAIIKDGTLISCNRATIESCAIALKAPPKEMGGGGY